MRTQVNDTLTRAAVQTLKHGQVICTLHCITLPLPSCWHSHCCRPHCRCRCSGA